MGKKQTDFQRKVYECVRTAGPLGASTWQIAQMAFPEKWKVRAGRGALIGHIDNAGEVLGLVRLAPKTQFCDATFYIPGIFA